MNQKSDHNKIDYSSLYLKDKNFDPKVSIYNIFCENIDDFIGTFNRLKLSDNVYLFKIEITNENVEFDQNLTSIGYKSYDEVGDALNKYIKKHKRCKI